MKCVGSPEHATVNTERSRWLPELNTNDTGIPKQLKKKTKVKVKVK